MMPTVLPRLTGAVVAATVPLWNTNYPAAASTYIYEGDVCPPVQLTSFNWSNQTVTVSRAATYIKEVRGMVDVKNYALAVYPTLIGYATNGYDVPDGSRTNRFEDRYYRVNYVPSPIVTVATNYIVYYWYVTNSVLDIPGDINSPHPLDTTDPDPVYSDPFVATNTLEALSFWDDAAADYIGFTPPGPYTYVDGYTNADGTVKGDLTVTALVWDEATSAYIEPDDVVYQSYHEIPVQSNLVAELNVPHTNSWTVVLKFDEEEFPLGLTFAAFDPYYRITLTPEVHITNSWIMLWEPAIKWDVPDGLYYVTPYP
jgi:hypothetical protein